MEGTVLQIHLPAFWVEVISLCLCKDGQADNEEMESYGTRKLERQVRGVEGCASAISRGCMHALH